MSNYRAMRPPFVSLLRRFSLPRTAFGLAALLLAGLCGSCGEAPVPELPGVAAGEQEWFWRDVLAAPLPAEPAPRRELLSGAESGVVEALAGLVSAGDEAALPTLLAALNDPRDGVALVAAEQLGRLGDPRALPRLIKGLGPYPVDYDPPIARRAAQAAALARLGHPGGVELLLDLIAEGSDAEAPRGALVWEATTQVVFLQELALPGLVALAGDDFGFAPNASVPDRTAAAEQARAWWAQNRRRLWQTAPALETPGLVARARLLVENLGAYQLRQVDGARHTLAQLGPPVLPFLAEALASDDPYLRIHGLQVLGRLAGRADVKTDKRIGALASTSLLEAVDPSEAAAAAEVCGAVAFADPLLVALRRRTEPEVLVAVVDALGRCEAGAALPALRGLAFDDSTPDLRVARTFALFRLDPEWPPDDLLELLTEAGPELAAPALDRLARWSGRELGLDPYAPTDERHGLHPQLYELLVELKRGSSAR